MAPTVLKEGPYRVYFVSHDLQEPVHVHVDRDDCSAKFWLTPVSLARNIGFAPVELRKIEALVLDKVDQLLEAWNGHPGSSGR